MAKKSKSLSYLKPSWLTTFFLGIVIGIASQQIPQVKAFTHEIIQPVDPHFTHASALSGSPTSTFIIHRQGYSLAYDARNKNPAWVYEHLTSDGLKGGSERTNEFKEDESIPKQLRATLADYKGKGFDRGHMAPAADHKSSAEAMSDTFFMTNMCPQCPKLNRGYWSKLEKHVRDLTHDYQNIFVITGPLYLPYSEADGKRFIKYQVIGQNDVAVPSHFFKIITMEDRQGKKETRAYIFPNEDINSNTPLDSFKTTVLKVERAAGIIFNKDN